MSKKNKIGLGVLILLIIIGFLFFFLKSGDGEVEMAEVVRGDIYREIFSTGSIKLSEEVNLGFQRSGLVSAIYINEGDEVQSGAEIARLNQGDILSQIRAAEATLEIEQITLRELERGATDAEIDISLADVEKVEVAFENSKKSLLRNIEESYTETNHSISSYADLFFSNNNRDFGISFIDGNTKYNFTTTDSKLRSHLKYERRSIVSALDDWGDVLDGLSDLSGGELFLEGEEFLVDLKRVRRFFNDLSVAVSDFSTDNFSLVAKIEGYKQSVLTGQNIVNSSISKLDSALRSYNSAKASLELSKRQYDKLIFGSTDEKISSQKARVTQAGANLEALRNQASQMIIRAPVSGKIVSENARVGEVVQSGEKLFILFPEGEFELEVDLYEGDVGFVEVGDNAEVNIVAFPEETFDGYVVSIDQVPSLVDGVVHYKVKIGLEEAPRILSGMTADAVFNISQKENVLVIPNRAVSRVDNESYVMVHENGKLENRKITTGSRSDDGKIEVLEGLNEGEIILVE